MCSELVMEYSLVHAYYLEAFPYILCCAYVNSCSIIEPQFPVLLEGSQAAYENKKAVVTMATDTKHTGTCTHPSNWSGLVLPAQLQCSYFSIIL